MKALQVLKRVLDEQEQQVLRIVIDGGMDNPETYISRVEVYNRTTMGSTQVDGILDRLGAAGLIESTGAMVRADMMMELLRESLAWNTSAAIERDEMNITVQSGIPGMITGACMESATRVANGFGLSYSVVMRDGQPVIKISLP